MASPGQIFSRWKLLENIFLLDKELLKKKALAH